jgi:hypothetical protein
MIDFKIIYNSKMTNAARIGYDELWMSKISKSKPKSNIMHMSTLKYFETSFEIWEI